MRDLAISVTFAMFLAWPGFSHAEPRFWKTLCEKLLSSVSGPPKTLELQSILFGDEVRRINRRSHFESKVIMRRCDSLIGQPWTLEIQVDPRIQILVLQDSSELNWEDRFENNFIQPALVVRYSSRDLPHFAMSFKTEFQNLLSRVEGLKAELNDEIIGENANYGFKREYYGENLIWISGRMKNYQMKRLILISAQIALTQATAQKSAHHNGTKGS